MPRIRARLFGADRQCDRTSNVNRPLINGAGFTILEMLVTIVIMGLVLLLLAYAMPPNKSRLAEQSAVRQVVEAMRLARGTAIAQDQPVSLALPHFTGPVVALLQAPADRIIFAPDGSASGGQVVVTGAGETTVISADWLTGSISVNAP